MQSVPPKFRAFPCEPSATPGPTPQKAHAGTPTAYIPHTVWQTPHGLAPSIAARRSVRNGRTAPLAPLAPLAALAALVRRGMRLRYRLRRLLGAPQGGWDWQRFPIPS